MHLEGSGTVHRPATMTAPLLLLTSSLCFTVVGQDWWGDGYRLVTIRTPGDFIMLSHWNTRPPAPWPAVSLSHIILILSQLVLALF